MAMQFMYSVKRYMTHPEYTALQLAFGPPDGWKASADQWRADAIYTGGEDRVGVEKDPTLQALGMGGQIYGVRSKLIILDDCVTLSNAHEWEKQMDWIRQEVSSRLDPFGKLLVVGTRVAPQDLYRELRNEDHYTDGTSPWTYLAQPAVLEMPDPNDAETWVTLWPESHVPFEGSKEEALPNGNYTRWTGPRLKKIRNDAGPSRWAMVYQQLDVAMEATFNAACVRACVNGMRKPGPLNVASAGHPDNIDGFVTICALDPAFTGYMAAIAMAVDPSSGKRYVLDVKTLKNQTTVLIHETIAEFTERYRPREWIIEQNAAQLYFLNDPWLTSYLRTKGVALRGHFTGRNKQDPDFGVASMAPMFGTLIQKDGQTTMKHAGDQLIELPDQYQPGIKELVEQLITWTPAKKAKNLIQDTVMALWFAELAAREVMVASDGKEWFMKNSWTSVADENSRMVVNLDELLHAPHKVYV
jgi:hypothetical protein